MTETSYVQERQYQTKILELVDLSIERFQNPIIELDCGMGKRVLMLLLLQKFRDQNTVVILQSTASLFETRDYFQKNGLKDIAFLTSRISGRYRQKLVEESRIVLCTPQTLENTLKKMDQSITKRFDIVIINEIDTLVRRTAYGRIMVHPYSTLLPRFTNSTLIGMSGTLRDSHLLVDAKGAEFVREIDTLADNLTKVRLISMEEIMSGTDFEEYVSTTEIVRMPVEDPEVVSLLIDLDDLVRQHREELEEELADEEPELLDNIPKGSLAAMVDLLPLEEKVKNRYKGLMMLRKYLVSMVPSQSKKFLYRVKELDRAKIKSLTAIPSRMKTIVNLLGDLNEKRAVVLCSYIKTAETICEEMGRGGYEPFLITGQVASKNEVLDGFRTCKKPCVLVMTSVGERDLDIQETKLLIIYDTINTTKTMYQRLKRTRGGKVVFLYYPATSEERKVARLMGDIKQKYPWTVEIHI
ncbi:MAG: helicase-related protein [Candidatus Odinarchaeota archaeon]